MIITWKPTRTDRDILYETADGIATMLFYMTEDAQEGRNAFLEKRPPDFSKFPRRP